MIKNILYTIGILATIAVYYLFYEYQNKRFESLESKLVEISNKIDNISNDTSDNITNSLNYKENNIVKNDIINFSDSLIKLFNNDSMFKKVFDSNIDNDTINQKETIDDGFCYDLAEQYKIINFYNSKIRIKNISIPGSILMSVNDSLNHNNGVYILKQINGEGSFVKFENLNDKSHCKLHKVKP